MAAPSSSSPPPQHGLFRACSSLRWSQQLPARHALLTRPPPSSPVPAAPLARNRPRGQRPKAARAPRGADTRRHSVTSQTPVGGSAAAPSWAGRPHRGPSPTCAHASLCLRSQSLFVPAPFHTPPPRSPRQRRETATAGSRSLSSSARLRGRPIGLLPWGGRWLKRPSVLI